MKKTKTIITSNILQNNQKINTELIDESDRLRRNSFGGLKTPEYTLSPALGTEKERLKNRAKIYHLG